MAKQWSGNGSPAAKNGSLSPGARRALLVLKRVAQVFAWFVMVQMFIAGMATFVDSDNWMAHTNFAHVFILFPVTLIFTSFTARLPATYRVKGLILLVTVILMYATAKLSPHIGFLSALHPVIALVMFWNSMNLAKQADVQLKAQ